MEKPKPKELSEAVGISQSYASMILSDESTPAQSRRTPPRSLAILIFRKTGWRHESIAELTEEQMQVFEEVEPWTPTARTEAA